MRNQVETITFTPEKSKQVALARLDLIRKWKEFRKNSVNKLQADYDFVKLHNSSNSHLFDILGKISCGSLHRWNNMLNGSENYELLLPQYKYSSVNEYRTVLTDVEIKIFMGLLLHPNKISMAKLLLILLLDTNLKSKVRILFRQILHSEDMQNGTRIIIMINGFWQGTVKKLCQIR